MSIFSSIINGLSKAENFLISIFTKTSAIAQAITKLSPTTLAAMLATFYDVIKVVQSAETVFTDAVSGNVTAAITMSQTTVALIKQVVADGKNDASVIAADLKALGIAASTDASTTTTA